MGVLLEGVPKYLHSLLEPTPSSLIKLNAAWDGLCFETQLMVIDLLPKVSYPNYLTPRVNSVRDKALRSSVPYIRYLAYLDNTDRKTESEISIKSRLELDIDPLVRYSMKETTWSLFSDPEFKDPERFLSLPQDARLARLRLLEANALDVSKIITHAIDNHLVDGRLTELELLEMLADYIIKPSFKAHLEGDEWRKRYDGWGQHQAGIEIEALWNLIPICPRSIAFFLIQHLPPKAGFYREVKDDILETLTEEQLTALLYRKDIGLRGLRRKFYLDHTRGEAVRSSAVSANFEAEYSDITDILSLGDKEKNNALKFLAMNGGSLQLVIYRLLYDLISLTDWESAGLIEISFDRRLSQLENTGYRDLELLQLRLYILARRAVPWKSDHDGSPPLGEISFLAEQIVPGNTWSTFLGFQSKWKSLWNARSLEGHLPRIEGVDPDEADDDLDASIPEPESVVNVILEKTTHLEKNIAALSEAVEGLPLLRLEITEELADIRKEFDVATQTHYMLDLESVRDSEKRLSLLIKGNFNRAEPVLYLISGLLLYIAIKVS